MAPQQCASGKPRVLAIAGSLRQGSYNRRLLDLACQGAKAAGGEVTELDLGRYPLPLYGADLERTGLPEPARALQELVRTHDGLLIATPEYYSTLPPLLVNVLVWVSRAAAAGQACVFVDKVAGLLSASTAQTGGLRGISQLSSILGNLGAIVVPYPVGVSYAQSAFTSAGELHDKALEGRVAGVGRSVIELIQRLS